MKLLLLINSFIKKNVKKYACILDITSWNIRREFDQLVPIREFISYTFIQILNVHTHQYLFDAISCPASANGTQLPS